MDYFSILTNAGLSKLIKATANNAQIVLTQMGVSDTTEPITQDLTTLPNEKHKFSINTITQSENDANVLICEGVISADVGGFYIRKVGIYTDDGVLFAVGAVPDSYKPLLSEGSSKDITIKFYLQVANSANITLKVDNNIVLASRSYVADELKKLDAKFLPLTAKAADSDKLDGKDSLEFVLKSELKDLMLNAETGLKIGSYLLWSSQSVTPSGFLVCDGRSLNKSEYLELFNVIGYTYGGSGDNFNIPNFSDGKFFRSVGGNAAALGTAQTDAIRNITGMASLIDYELRDNLYFNGAFASNNTHTTTNGTEQSASGAKHLDVKFDASKVVPTANENRPYNMSVVVLIKVKDVKEPNASQIDTTLYASEVKAGIVKLKNEITGDARDAAVTENAVKDFLKSVDFKKSSTGYLKLSNGLIIQWGRGSGVSNEDRNYWTLPLAYPNSCLAAFISTEAPDSISSDSMFQIVTYSKTSISYRLNSFTGINGSYNPHFFTIGY
ncbi:phage tail protein [Campylobacter mucosalis]|uniref:Phage tail-collar fiber protein (DUF3751 domain) n=1 Tax=Campylobacter mucosalis CCUG 21559 TaxID=1032067 RepID=A0A6G5QFT1_9BACT|nr:phage tail protein [Campylobacter mucosalis]QCD44459.1 phage tail-collar fiber protein (DUF3751 domain) [Campylobacter mucosalis CCUG 21559]